MIAKLIALVLPLGLDTFAVAAAIGMVGVTARQQQRFTLLCTSFEAGMPLIGLALGAPLGHAIGLIADYVAIGVLLCSGLYTLLGENEENAARLADARGIRALLLGVSVSLDELAVGFALGLLRLPIAPVIALIAVQTVVLTQVGLRLGNRVSEHGRERAEQLAGLALMVLALVLLIPLRKQRALGAVDIDRS